jgi:O-antigen/teichoic acid export membrane protein
MHLYENPMNSHLKNSILQIVSRSISGFTSLGIIIFIPIVSGFATCGMLSIVGIISQIINNLLFSPLRIHYTRHYFSKYSICESYQNFVMCLLLVFILLMVFILVILFLKTHVSYLYWGILYGATIALSEFSLEIARLNSEFWNILFLQSIKLISVFTISIIYLKAYKFLDYYLILSALTTSNCMVLLFTIFNIKYRNFILTNITRKSIMNAYKFGLPNSIAALLNFQNIGVDKILILSDFGKATVGIYSLITDLCQITNGAIAGGIQGAISNKLMIDFDGGELNFKKLMYIIFYRISIFSTIAVLLSVIIIKIIFSMKWYPHYSQYMLSSQVNAIMILIILSVPILCLKTFGIDYWYFLNRKTLLILLNSSLGLLFGFITVFSLIRTFGPIAGTIGSIASSAVCFIPLLRLDRITKAK